MNYSIKELADLTGVTPKTLRYYDQIQLLTPHSYTKSGYRQYSQTEVDRLHHILLYKSFGLPLEQIKTILEQASNPLDLLKEHKQLLLEKQHDLARILQHVDATIANLQGECPMTNEEKFKTFKEQVQVNETENSVELQKAYGEDVVKHSLHTMKHMTPESHAKWCAIEADLLDLLNQRSTYTIPSDSAQTLYQLHKDWLTMSWGSYTNERHHGLAQLYLMSPEFTAYYDQRTGHGATTFLVSVIEYYAAS